jgi:hypothetical protein
MVLVVGRERNIYATHYNNGDGRELLPATVNALILIRVYIEVLILGFKKLPIPGLDCH